MGEGPAAEILEVGGLRGEDGARKIKDAFMEKACPTGPEMKRPAGAVLRRPASSAEQGDPAPAAEAPAAEAPAELPAAGKQSPIRLRAKTGVARSHFTHEASDGKGPSDGYNNVPRHAVVAGLKANELLDPGTRELVYYLAKRCSSPSVAKANKQGWWAAEGYIWAYYDTALFTKAAVPEAEGYAGSKENHQHVGLCKDKETAERDGPSL